MAMSKLSLVAGGTSPICRHRCGGRV